MFIYELINLIKSENDLNNINNIVFENMNNENYKNLLKEYLKKIFKFNGFNVSDSYLSMDIFNNFCDFIFYNFSDNIIKSENDLKFYIINELDLQISNTEILYKRFIVRNKKECLTIDNNFKFIYN